MCCSISCNALGWKPLFLATSFSLAPKLLPSSSKLPRTRLFAQYLDPTMLTATKDRQLMKGGQNVRNRTREAHLRHNTYTPKLESCPTTVPHSALQVKRGARKRLQRWPRNRKSSFDYHGLSERRGSAREGGLPSVHVLHALACGEHSRLAKACEDKPCGCGGRAGQGFRREDDIGVHDCLV